MRVLHVQKVSGVAGSERHLLSLLPALEDRGIETKLCVLATQDHNRFEDLASVSGIEMVFIPSESDFQPRLVSALAKLARGMRADIVHTHLIHADLYGQLGAALARVPGVVSFHSTNPFFRKLPYRVAERAANKLARRTIAISEHVRGFIEELRLSEPEKVEVIHYGIDVEAWLTTEGASQAARTALGGSPDEVIVGVASRLFRRKGHALLIQAFASVVAEAPKARLYVAGEGPLMDELQTEAAARLPAESYRFLGHLNDVRVFMSACDIVVFPTLPGYGEGFGLAALEAMCAAKPVVATRLDSLPEILEDGITGLLVPPGDVAAMTAALLSLCSDAQRRQRIGAAGRIRARNEFSLTRMVEQTISVYSDVVSGREAGMGGSLFRRVRNLGS